LKVFNRKLHQAIKDYLFKPKTLKMKRKMLFIMVCLMALAVAHAQKWNELTDEQKQMKLKEFRVDNQKYLKTKLGMTQQQLDDIDNVNLCYISTLDRINRYAKDDASKEKLADAVFEARWVQLDAIMGADKHKQFAEYVKGKIEKAKSKK
jgi:DNA polymerase III alpha subunit (gram-positive type)